MFTDVEVSYNRNLTTQVHCPHLMHCKHTGLQVIYFILSYSLPFQKKYVRLSYDVLPSGLPAHSPRRPHPMHPLTIRIYLNWLCDLPQRFASSAICCSETRVMLQ